MPALLPRLFAALPDLVTAGIFLLTWIAPGVLGPQRAKDLMLTMLIEFIVMHSSAFYAAILGMRGVSRLQQSLWLAGLSAFYVVFILGFSFGFASTWPIWTFAWLLASRFWHLWIAPTQNDSATSQLMSTWTVSAMAYLGGVFLTLLLPLPRLGITAPVIIAMHFPPGMSGLWVDKPWIVLAFGAFYFAVLAWSKFRPMTTSINKPIGH